LKPAGSKAVVLVFIAFDRNSADRRPSNKGATPDLLYSYSCSFPKARTVCLQWQVNPCEFLACSGINQSNSREQLPANEAIAVVAHANL
jgi:hypothetical protein